MIEISYTYNRITITGHANYAEHGKDIVCSAVSALTQTLIESIETLTNDTIEYSISPGTVDIHYRNLSERAKLLVDSFFIGVQMIADEYKDYVQIL